MRVTSKIGSHWRQRMALKPFDWTSTLASEAGVPPLLALYQRYWHRYGLVISFALFHTETYLYNSPSTVFLLGENSLT